MCIRDSGSIGNVVRPQTEQAVSERRKLDVYKRQPYALYRETAQNHAQVFVGRWYLAGVAKYEVVFLSLLALERRLSERPCLILHCAYPVSYTHLDRVR